MWPWISFNLFEIIALCLAHNSYVIVQITAYQDKQQEVKWENS